MDAETFDYIIIGAGSAGCVLADRLSANPRHKVLLLEAGGSDRKFAIKMPLGYAMTFADPEVNWCYWGAPDAGLKGRKTYVPRGRVLGGSSSINAMAYLRGLPHDFQDWERAGATGWNWAAVERSYDMLETRSEFNATGQRITQGAGPVWVSDLSDQMPPFTQNFLAAAQDMGWPVSNDLNQVEKEGLSLMRSNVRNGRRWSCADAFLRPAQKRANLRVLTRCLVERITLENGRATGVQYRLNEKTVTAHCGKEVLLSAGAINSPQVLQLSGIGPAALLKRHGILVQHDLSQVGEGLQDHLALSHFYRTEVPTLNTQLGRPLGRFWAGLRYLLTKSGPLSVPVNHCSGFVRSHPDAPQPDLQIYCNPASYTIRSSGKVAMDRDPGFLLCAQPSRPTSRGSITLASADPKLPPVIQPNSLSTKEDRDIAIRAGRVLQALAQTPTIARLTTKRLEPDIVGLEDEALLENFRARASSVFHPTSTCRMGQNASDSVLDARLRVHGIAGLRVVDASAFPNVTSGNTNAPTIMLAARAADFILQDDQQRTSICT